MNSKLLMRKNPKKKDKRKYKYSERIAVPKSLINKLISSAHAPHFGIRKAYKFLNEKYYWKRMYLDTKKFCKSCSNCIQSKSNTTSSSIIQCLEIYFSHYGIPKIVLSDNGTNFSSKVI